MRNFLRTDYLNAFIGMNDTSKRSENVSGGVALWDKPYVNHCAFNPILFTRTRYYHKATSYEPEYTHKPNYITISSFKLIAAYQLTSTLRIGYHKEGDTGTLFATFAAGTSELDLSGIASSIDSIVSVSLASAPSDTDYCADTYYTFIREGYAYCDSLYMCSTAGDVMYVSTVVETAFLDIYRQDGTTLGQKLAAESYNGIIKFDAAPVVKTWFAEQLAAMDSALVADPKLYTRFVVKGIGGVGTSYQFVAVNAVAQIGDASDRGDWEGLVLTDFDKLKLYDGYPLDYSVLSAEAETTARGTTEANCVSRVRVDDYLAELQTEAVEDTTIQDEAGDDIYIIPSLDKRVFPQCAPSQPFYIRWINQLGGVDYYMFSRQQKKQPTVKGVDTHSTFVANPANARSNSRAYNITTENKVTVGAQGIPTPEYAPLSRLPFAPTIELYDTERSNWVALTVSSFDGTYDTKNATHDIEIVFSLPSIFTQF